MADEGNGMGVAMSVRGWRPPESETHVAHSLLSSAARVWAPKHARWFVAIRPVLAWPIVGYVTDVEGNWRYWERYLERSMVLRRREDVARDHADALELSTPTARFVFGGDVCDKGPGDLRIAAQLVSLKQRYPERVTLIAGNRDCNKLKLTSELSADDLARPPESIPGPYWVHPSHSVTFSRYLATMEEAEEGAAHSRVHRLQWLLQWTMGCARSFEHRRHELGLLLDHKSVTDEQIADSYVAQASEGGVMRAFMRHAQLAAIVGNTMFVHAHLSDASLCWLPSMENRDAPQTAPPPGTRMEEVREWVPALNAWMQQCLDTWEAQPHWDATRTQRGGSALMGYFYNAAMHWHSVGVMGFLSRGHVTPMDEACRRKLLEARVQRVVVGHKPCGDSPLIIRSRDDAFEVVCADTSFSDPDAPDDTRGDAVSEVLLFGPTLDRLRALVHGVRANGERLWFVLAPFGENEVIGKEQDGWIARARIGSHLVLWSQTRNRVVSYRHTTVPADTPSPSLEP